MQDYYKTLDVTQEADSFAIRSAYRNLALKWHPLRNDSKDSKAKFNAISEAYEVLSQSELRALFDKFGEVALKFGVPDGQGGTLGGNYAYEENGDDIFEKFFGTSNPFASVIEETGRILAAGPSAEEQMKTNQKVYFDVALEDFYLGSTKEFKVGSRVLTIPLLVGYGDGTELLFKADGDNKNITVVLRNAKHDVFERSGDDLSCTVTVSILEALTGCSVSLQTLDKRTINIPCSDIIRPGFQMSIAGEGMPKEDGSKGNLTVKFNISFPSALKAEQKLLLNAALAFPKTLSKSQTEAIEGVKKAF